MFLDISGCDLMSEDDVSDLRETLRNELGDAFVHTRRKVSELQSFLHDKQFAVVRSAISSDDSELIDNGLTDRQIFERMNPSLATRVRLEDDCRLVPLSSIESYCHAIPVDRNIIYEDSTDFFIMKDIDDWRQAHLYDNNNMFVVSDDDISESKKSRTNKKPRRTK